jgi:hypothetical protein
MPNFSKLFSIEATFPILCGFMYDGFVCPEMFKFERRMKAGYA